MARPLLQGRAPTQKRMLAFRSLFVFTLVTAWGHRRGRSCGPTQRRHASIRQNALVALDRNQVVVAHAHTAGAALP